MTVLGSLVKRNCKLFFKDRGMFFTSLITPAILLVLYVTFLADTYRSAIVSNAPTGFVFDENLLDGLVGGQLVSSILAVSAVTVAFSSNFLMAQDKISGVRVAFISSPVKRSVLALGYFISCELSTLIVCFAALSVCLIYLGAVGWYLSAADVAYLALDVFLLSLFGTALSSIVNRFLSTNGQCSAVGTIVSAGYGFICGAYMPISNFGDGLKRLLYALPGTYGTSLMRNHAMGGAFDEMTKVGIPPEAVDEFRTLFDCNPEFFGRSVGIDGMFAILISSAVFIVIIYVLIDALCGRKKFSA